MEEREIKFDTRTVLEALIKPFLYWTLAVIALTWFGYPMVTCLTPLAWFLAIPVGIEVMNKSRSDASGGPVWEAAAAGAALGLYQGLLFMAVNVYVTSTMPEARSTALTVSWVSIIFSMIAAGTLALVGAVYINPRLRQKE